MQSKDLIVIGGGPGGYVAAIRAAQLGMKVTLIERDELGGTCLNIGCIPTKALLKSAHMYNAAKNISTFGIDIQNMSFDLNRIMKRKEKATTKLTTGVGMLLKKNKVEVIRGEACFQNENTVTIDGESYHFAKAIIASGSQPVSLPIPGIDEDHVIFSTAALNMDHIPKRLAIIGGGVIAVEFASIFSAFGSQVTIVEMMPSILPLIDEELSKSLQKILEKQNISIHTSAKLNEIRKESIVIFKNEKIEEITCDTVLVAVGRKPDLQSLKLENTKIAYTAKGIKVNEHMQTNIPHIYAVGDAVPTPQLAHVAMKEGIVAAEQIAGQNSRMKYDSIPSCVYTTPEVASVGLSEAEAVSKGISYSVGKFPLIANGRAIVEGSPEGFVKILADEDDSIIGVHIMAPHASEMIYQASLAMSMEASVEELLDSVYPHPTVSEAVMEAALALRGRTIHF